MAVYFIRAGEDGPIKIGYAADPKARLRAMQTGSSLRLRLIALIEGDAATEKETHARFASHRELGEWFTPHAEILAYCANHQVNWQPHQAPDVGSATEIITQLGGRQVVADLCGVTYNAVCNWCAWNSFPRRVYLDIARACRDRDEPIPLPEELFERINPGAARAGAA